MYELRHSGNRFYPCHATGAWYGVAYWSSWDLRIMRDGPNPSSICLVNSADFPSHNINQACCCLENVSGMALMSTLRNMKPTYKWLSPLTSLETQAVGYVLFSQCHLVRTALLCLNRATGTEASSYSGTEPLLILLLCEVQQAVHCMILFKSFLHPVKFEDISKIIQLVSSLVASLTECRQNPRQPRRNG